MLTTKKEKAMSIKDFKKGYSYSINLVDGDNFTGEFSRIERGFILFVDYAGKEHPIRIENVKDACLVCSCCNCNPCDCH